jgi:hypothetical protein|uniref:Uncharacterized protein n=1 Tax=viral metagenome TaxID=1070528 RepID=A0A6C0LB35_9ZZZZ
MTELEFSVEMRAQMLENFVKCVKGYHFINDDPIKETPWEDINAQILIASGCSVTKQSNGSHKPGADLSCSIGDLSNKSTQYDKDNKSFKVSSYRLTTVCSDKTPGNIQDITAEINRRKNFKYYSIIVREETDSGFRYDWYLFPSDYPEFNPSSYTWTPKLGKISKNKGVTTGWETNTLNGSSMSISFSMSSQLWMDIVVTEEMKKFIIASCNVIKGRKLNYIQLFDRESEVSLPLASST